jgi:DNA-binding XRE family transcriptional regulator
VGRIDSTLDYSLREYTLWEHTRTSVPPMEKSTHAPEYHVLIGMLRETRTAAGVTQVDMAQRLGITQSFVSKLERGELRLDFIQVRQYCQVVGVPFATFVRQYEKRLEDELHGRRK